MVGRLPEKQGEGQVGEGWPLEGQFDHPRGTKGSQRNLSSRSVLNIGCKRKVWIERKVGSGWRRLGGEEGPYISDLQVMDDGVLGDIEIIGVDNVEREDGLTKVRSRSSFRVSSGP